MIAAKRLPEDYKAPTDKKTIRKVLRYARRLLRQGWTQGAYKSSFDGTTCYCSAGAIQAAIHVKITMPMQDQGLYPQYKYDADLEGAAREAVRKQTGAPSLIAWNDQPERKKHEVVEAFEDAIHA